MKVSATTFALLFNVLAAAQAAQEACNPSEEQCLSGKSSDGKVLMQAKTRTAKKLGGVGSEDGLAKATLDLSSITFQSLQNGLKQNDPETWNFVMRGFGQTLVTFLIHVGLQLLVWKVAYPDPPVPVLSPELIEDPADTLAPAGIFGCMKEPQFCLCAALCPGIRWADTMRLANLLSIYMALSVIFVVSLISFNVNGVMVILCFLLYGVIGLIVLFVPIFPIVFVLCLYYRHKLREVLEVTSFTWETCLMDSLSLWFCPWCALAQEARAVHNAGLKGILKTSS